MACTLEFVDDVQSAIDHINRYGRYAVFLHTISSSLFFLEVCSFSPYYIPIISLFFLELNLIVLNICSFQCTHRLHYHY